MRLFLAVVVIGGRANVCSREATFDTRRLERNKQFRTWTYVRACSKNSHGGICKRAATCFECMVVFAFRDVRYGYVMIVAEFMPSKAIYLVRNNIVNDN